MVRRAGSHPIARSPTSAAVAPRPEIRAPRENTRAWAPRPAGRAQARPVDGNAWCAKTLVEIKVRVARGEAVKVVFDIDDTLSDGRARTIAVGKAFDHKHGTHYFDGVSKDRIQHSGLDTAVALTIPSPDREAFVQFWDKAFWASKAFAHDEPIGEVVKLAKDAAKAGAEIIYLTGRVQHLEKATLAQLKRFGLPQVDARHVASKPGLGTSTPEWRANWLAKHAPSETAFFITESRRDIAQIQSTLPGLACVLFDSPFSGDSAIDASTPVFRARF